MLIEASAIHPGSAHVIVLGNEKGGSGKSTLAMHITVALMKAGHRVATIDLDCRQRSFTRYIANRHAWSEHAGVELGVPRHACLELGEAINVADNEAAEFQQFAEAIAAVEHDHAFIVIDTPGSDSYLMRLAHCMADTLITPINDSALDFDVLGSVDPTTGQVAGFGSYATMMIDARRRRQELDGIEIEWVVVRNRLSTLGARINRTVAAGLQDLSRQIGFRPLDGFAERLVYRELFTRGLTALDPLDQITLGAQPSMGHVAAREEVAALLRHLNLRIDQDGRDSGAYRAERSASSGAPSA